MKSRSVPILIATIVGFCIFVGIVRLIQDRRDRKNLVRIAEAYTHFHSDRTVEGE